MTAVGNVISSAVLQPFAAAVSALLVHRPADPQGGVRRRAAHPGRDPSRLMLAPGPPLATLRRRGPTTPARRAPAQRVPPAARAAAHPRLDPGGDSREVSEQRPGRSWVATLVTMLVGAVMLVGLVLVLSRLRRDRRRREHARGRPHRRPAVGGRAAAPRRVGARRRSSLRGGRGGLPRTRRSSGRARQARRPTRHHRARGRGHARHVVPRPPRAGRSWCRPVRRDAVRRPSGESRGRRDLLELDDVLAGAR